MYVCMYIGVDYAVSNMILVYMYILQNMHKFFLFLLFRTGGSDSLIVRIDNFAV